MSKKLFTKLQLGEARGESERAVTALLEGIVSASADVYEQVALAKMSKQLLTREVMYREVNSVGQAFPRDPWEGELAEENALKLQVKEGNRPFSAKIEKVYRQARSSSKKSAYGFKRGSTRSTHKYSLCHSVKSKEPKRYGNFRPNHDRFFPLHPEHEEQDSAEEAFIDSLRAKKAQELAYQRSKENFLKASVEQGEKYARLNRKFLQTMGSKPYYYNRNGETVELATTAPARPLKKTASSRVSRQQMGTRRTNQVRSEVTVEYQEKQNYFKRTREAFEIQARPAVLYYKSEQCKYQVLA